MVDEIAAVATADASHCTEIQATWLAKHRDQSAVLNIGYISNETNTDVHMYI